MSETDRAAVRGFLGRKLRESDGQRKTAPRSLGMTSWTKHLALLAGVLAVWQAFGMTVFQNSLFISPPSEIAETLYSWFSTGFIWPHLRTSLLELAFGFALAILVGVTVGVFLGSYKWLYSLLNPWVALLYATPLVAVTPIFILALGIGVASKAALVFSLAVFPVIVNTSAGFRSVDSNYIELAHSYCASSVALALKFRFPAALPFIITGLRLGSGRAVIGAVVGELFVAKEGVGYLISLASTTFDAAALYAGVVIFSVIGLSLFYFFEFLEVWLVPWKDTGGTTH